MILVISSGFTYTWVAYLIDDEKAGIIFPERPTTGIHNLIYDAEFVPALEDRDPVEFYGLSYTDETGMGPNSENKLDTVFALFNRWAIKMAQLQKGSIIKTRDMFYHGTYHPGMEFFLSLPNNKTGWVQLFLVNQRLYIVQTTYAPVKTNARMAKFMDSFQINE